MGDALMANFLFENIKENNLNFNYFLVIPRNKDVVRQIVKDKNIKIIELSKKNIFSYLKLFIFLFSNNYILTSPTPGKQTKKTKFIVKLLSLKNKSKSVGYEDSGKNNKKFYKHLIPFNDKILYYELLLKSLEFFGLKIKKEKPNIQNNFTKKDYVVLHPFGSGDTRSFLKEDLDFLISEIRKNFAGDIFITGSAYDRKFINKIKDDRVFLRLNLKIDELVSLIGHSSFYIGVDTGPTHIASFLNKKSLVLARNGTPNWLPYYNNNSTIIYEIKNCKHEIYKGREHLESCRGDLLRCLLEIPRDIISREIKNFFNE